MNNCGKVREGYIGGADWIFPQFQAIKDNSVVLTINKILHDCVGKVGGFKISDAVGTSIRLDSEYDMVLNPTLDFFLPSLMAVGISEKRTAYYSIWFFKHFPYAGRSL